MPPEQTTDLPSALRQWTVYPRLPGRTRLSSPQVFRLLVETMGGRLLVASISLREPPDAGLVTILASLVDEPCMAAQSHLRIQGEFQARHGHTLELVEVDLDHDDPVILTSIVARLLVEQITQGGVTVGGSQSIASRRDSIESSCRSDWQTMRDRFIDKLDAEGVRLARQAGGLTPAGYTYVMTIGAEQRRNRAQALQVFPVLRPCLMTPPYEPVLVAIDRGQPLIEVLANHWQASKAMVRTVRGVEIKDLGLLAGKLPLLMRLLNGIPSNWWPREPTAW